MTHINIADPAQNTTVQNAIDSLSSDEQSLLNKSLEDSEITALVDGRGLACPMPLLKTKVALRSVKDNDAVYVLATDPNSQTDLDAFCKQSGLTMVLNTQSNVPQGDSLEKLDTIFHLIITKTHGN